MSSWNVWFTLEGAPNDLIEIQVEAESSDKAEIEARTYSWATYETRLIDFVLVTGIKET